VIIFLFLLTIVTAVVFNHYFALPACIGMMTGFAYLQIYSYFIARKESSIKPADNPELNLPFDIFRHIRQVEWDTLLFFYGVMLCIAGLSVFGYLHLSSEFLYHGLDGVVSTLHQQTFAHIVLGLLSAIIDNIPLMYAVLTMDPQMSLGQWLLITLTTGVGGSVFSIGSAAGVALMGQARAHYTFMSHLKWSWAVLLGYFAAIAAHFMVNYSLFSQ
jgi:Na+/H+ antiporter NhaD/arsenite permease-like protein